MVKGAVDYISHKEGMTMQYGLDCSQISEMMPKPLSSS